LIKYSIGQTIAPKIEFLHLIEASTIIATQSPKSVEENKLIQLEAKLNPTRIGTFMQERVEMKRSVPGGAWEFLSKKFFNYVTDQFFDNIEVRL
jgi:hypothetical protein